MSSTEFIVTIYHEREHLDESSLERLRSRIDSALENDKRAGLIEHYCTVENNESGFD